MAEELNQTKEKKNIAPMLFKILLGLVFLLLGVWLWYNWRYDFFSVVKGCVGPILVLASLITFAIAKD